MTTRGNEKMNSSLGTQVGVHITKETLKKVDALLASIFDLVGAKVREFYEDWSATFGEHLQVTFDRCSKIKTILHTDEPANLLEQYVSAKLKCRDKIYDDLDFIDEIWKRKRIIISGTGGGGKTVLMKYLWICFFENPKGKIPLFIELRGLNSVTGGDLKSYIFHTVVSSRAKISQEAFDRGVKAGLFIFMFDGFDEIVETKRSQIERDINEIAQTCPDNIVIVSGRSDERFDGWQLFSNFKVLPLNQEQVVSLIERLDYDRDIKQIFLKKLKGPLYEQHKSFLSTPLLSIMMLMTFNQFADIPEKIHIFYEQAFITLFLRHDALKSGFKRENRTKLAIHDFRKVFSFFCLTSYYATAYEFDDAEILSYLKKAIALGSSNVRPDDMLHDLINCVCLIQRDGLKYAFSHRSFQEFFSAYSLAQYSQDRIEKALTHLVRRPSDAVIPMLHDMNSAVVEDLFIIPNLTKLLGKLKAIDDSRYLEGYIAACDFQLMFAVTSDSSAYLHSGDGSFELSFINLMRLLYRESAGALEKSVRKSFPPVERRLAQEAHRALPTKKGAPVHLRGEVVFHDHDAFFNIGKDRPELKGNWIKSSDIVAHFKLESGWLEDLHSELLQSQMGRGKKMDDLFNTIPEKRGDTRKSASRQSAEPPEM